jgi:hypothetical protein
MVCLLPILQWLVEIADSTAMQRLSIYLTGVMLASLVMFAQEPNGGGPGPVLGIVEIPELFVIDEKSGKYAPRAAPTIYTRPSSESKVTTLIYSPEAVDTAEYGYEEKGALVYGREGEFFLIRTARGVGWLSPQDAGRFHPIEMLIKRTLTYLTDAWDGFVHVAPSGGKRTRVQQRRPYGPEDVRVKSLQNVGGKLWVEIEVISHSFCESDKPATVKASGWVPMHDETGAPTIWFSSRGC